MSDVTRKLETPQPEGKIFTVVLPEPGSMPPPPRRVKPAATAPKQRPVKPARRPRRGGSAASGGGLFVGLVALLGGLKLHSHYEPIKQLCASGYGAVAQAVEPNTQGHCGLDSALAEGGLVAAILGGIILVGTMLMLVGLFYEARLPAKS